MSLPARRLSGSGLRQFPRRKASQSQAVDSWEVLPDQPGHVGDAEDPMDLDVIPQRAFRESSIVNDLVDRIGREVELFAERLDAWKNRDRSTQQQKLDEAHDLLRRYRDEADALVAGFQRFREDEARYFSDTWHSTLPEHKVQQYGNSTEPNPDKIQSQDLRDWKIERDTWELAEDLLTHEMAHAQANGPCMAFAEDICRRHKDDRFSADGDLWISFLAQNHKARRTYIILKWLEKSAECTGNDGSLIEAKLESLSAEGRALFSHGWMNTKERIKNEKRLRLWDVPIDSSLPEIWNEDHTQLLVTQLDPDAPTRQNKFLERADIDFENAFWIVCWEMLKRGCTMSALQDWCSEKGQSAVALSLGAFLHTGSADSESNTISRYQWRRVCLQNAIIKKGSIFEKAVYGLLAGDTVSVLPACNSAEDLMYAYYNSLLLSDYSEFVLKRSTSSTDPTPSSDLHAAHADLHQSLMVLYDQTRKEASKDFKAKMRVLQESLMLGQFANLALEESIQLSIQDEKSSDHLIPTRFAALRATRKLGVSISNDEQVIRVFAHLYVLYRDIGLDFGDGDHKLATENLIGKYMSLLRQMGKYQLIPLYASFILLSRAEMSLGVVCRDILDSGERDTFLRLAEGGGFDAVNIVLNHYHLCDINFKGKADENTLQERVKLLKPAKELFWPGQRIAAKKVVVLSHQEEDIINSMEWFQVVEGNWATAFGTITRAALRFLSAGHIDALIALVNRVPCSELSKSKTAQSLGKSVDVFDDREDGEEDDAVDRVSSPVTKSKQARALTPQRARIHRDLFRHHARIYNEINQLAEALLALWEWRRAEQTHLSVKHEPRPATKAAIDRVVTAFSPIFGSRFLLQDPTDAGLLLDEGVARERVHMLEVIRKAYLPEMILAFDSALHCAGHLCTRDYMLDCLDLADKVAANGSLTACFTDSGRMHELVNAFAYNSKSLLGLNQNQAGKRRRGRAGRALHIWDVTA